MQAEPQELPVAVESGLRVQDGQRLDVLGRQRDVAESLRLRADQSRDPGSVPRRADGLDAHRLAEQRAFEDLADMDGEVSLMDVTENENGPPAAGGVTQAAQSVLYFRSPRVFALLRSREPPPRMVSRFHRADMGHRGAFSFGIAC